MKDPFETAALRHLLSIYSGILADFRAPFVQAYSLTESPVVRDLVARINTNAEAGHINIETVGAHGTPTLRDAFSKLLENDVVKAYVHATFDTLAKTALALGNIETALEYEFFDDLERELPRALVISHVGPTVILTSIADHLPVRGVNETGALDNFLARLEGLSPVISALARQVANDNAVPPIVMAQAFEAVVGKMEAGSTPGIESIYPRNFTALTANPF